MVTVILSNSGGELARVPVNDAASEVPVLAALSMLLAGADLQPGDTVTVIETD